MSKMVKIGWGGGGYVDRYTYCTTPSGDRS